MSNLQAIQYKGSISILLRAPEAIKNWRALVLLAATFVAVAVIVGTGGILASKFFDSPSMAMMIGGLFSLVAALVATSGVSGAGILLMDQARNIESRGIMDAFVSGVMSVLKFVLIFILDGLALLLFAVACALLLLVCKIPGIGPALYTLVFPLMILLSGAVFAALFFVVIPMTMPAIWDDSSIKGVYARRWAFFENRLVQIVIGLIALLLIIGVVAGIIDAILFAGFSFTAGLSVPILNQGFDISSLKGNMMGVMSGEGNGYFTAAVLGGGLLFLVAMSIPGLVYLLGINLIYLGAMEGLDISAAEKRVGQAMDEAKRRAEETKARAAEAAQRARDAADAQRARMTQSQPVNSMDASKVAQSPVATPATKLICPGCGVAITAEDVFCGECGHKLK
jgi:hypothetical protein